MSNGSLVVQTNSLIDGNSAQTYGGGISYPNSTGSGRSVTITDSTISNNNAYTTVPGASGGSRRSSASNRITVSHHPQQGIAGNTSSGNGGGLYLSLVNATLTDSTVSGNMTTGVEQFRRGHLLL